MATPRGYMPVPGSEPKIPVDHQQLNPTSEEEPVKLTLILRRRKDGTALRALKDFSAKSPHRHHTLHTKILRTSTAQTPMKSSRSKISLGIADCVSSR
jgi:hypothetical protein